MKSASNSVSRPDMVGSKNFKYRHGLHGIPEYFVWKGMKQRCSNPRSDHYRNYGARGIRVCERWSSFSVFLDDMGRRPSDKHTIERIDSSKGYEPGNCIWATRAAQARNTRQTRWLTFNGKTQCLTDWANELGINLRTLKDRLDVQKLTVEEAFTTPVRSRK